MAQAKEQKTGAADQGDQPGCSGLQNVHDPGHEHGEHVEIGEEDALLDDIVQSLTESEKTAPSVADKLAKIVNSRWLTKLNNNSFKEKMAKYDRPLNGEKLLTPKVNPEIWSRLDRQTRGKDLKLSSTQSVLTHIGSIAARTTDMLLKAKSKNDLASLDLDAMIRMKADAIALLGHVSFDISQRRRDTIRPHLNKDYATLCSSNVPITALLIFVHRIKLVIQRALLDTLVHTTDNSTTSIRSIEHKIESLF